MARLRFPAGWALLVLVAVTLAGCASEQTVFTAGETERGLASWYGSEGGVLTADGERYNPRELTAAHRHLPFGSLVRVTNTLNGNSVELRINDRGPWADDDRVIDVSEAAANILQMKGPGVVPVEILIERLGPSRRPTAVTE